MLSAQVGPGELTDVDRFIFESWGYFVIPDVLSADEVEECYAASERLHAARDHVFGQQGRGYETEPALERLIDHPAVLPKIRGLYGDRFILQACWSTMQPAHAGVGGWHQDGSSSGRRSYCRTKQSPAWGIWN
jgi:ectoine hydroxylase